MIRQRANLLRSKTYIPFNVAMQRARDELKPKEVNSARLAPGPVDDCWSRDRTGTSSSLAAGTGPSVSYARVVARKGGGNSGPGCKEGQENPTKQRSHHNSSARPRTDIKSQAAGKSGPSKEVEELLARLEEVTSVWDRPISPLWQPRLQRPRSHQPARRLQGL